MDRAPRMSDGGHPLRCQKEKSPAWKRGQNELRGFPDSDSCVSRVRPFYDATKAARELSRAAHELLDFRFRPAQLSILFSIRCCLAADSASVKLSPWSFR